eukprot:4397060-Prymnesium_polylepis.1
MQVEGGHVTGCYSQRSFSELRSVFRVVCTGFSTGKVHYTRGISCVWQRVLVIFPGGATSGGVHGIHPVRPPASA